MLCPMIPPLLLYANTRTVWQLFLSYSASNLICGTLESIKSGKMKVSDLSLTGTLMVFVPCSLPKKI